MIYAQIAIYAWDLAFVTADTPATFLKFFCEIVNKCIEEYENTFRLAGLALSGHPSEHWKRDLGREVLFHFLYCRHKPAPAMALAVCLSSPLMPWSRKEGANMAQEVMNGRYTLKPFYGADKDAREMLDLIRDEDLVPKRLIAALRLFVSLLELFVALLQAYIFTFLAALFIGMAVHPH